MEKQVEYEVRKFVSEIIDKKINEEFYNVKSKLREFSNFELICYSLLSMENGFKESVITGDVTHSKAASKRTVLEWFIKRLLYDKIRLEEFVYNKDKYDKFENMITELLIMSVNDLLNKQFKQHRGINKIQIDENDNNEFYFKVPLINDTIKCQDSYYWGNDIQNEVAIEQAEKKNGVTERIFNKYFSGVTSVKKNSDINKFVFMERIDYEIFELCKQNIEVDVDKIGSDFHSELFSNKQELINILAVFLYLSNINLFKDSILDPGGSVLFKNLTMYTKQKLISIIIKFSIMEKKYIEKIIDYFTFNHDINWGINEFPLLNIEGKILWVPSSFIMNDFQFSIVNGHYDKKIKIINRDDSVSESIVGNIVVNCSKYKNIEVATNKEYYDKINFYNGKELKSDIDVAVYDELSNTLLIIECKWLEKVYVKGDRYDKICDEVEKIYKKQLDKHKYFLELDENNIDYLFDNNENVKNRPYYPQILYIIVDKRIQLHYQNRHALSEFNFLKIINDNCINNILRLDNVISSIKLLYTSVEYKTNNTISQFKYKDSIIKNNIFFIK